MQAAVPKRLTEVPVLEGISEMDQETQEELIHQLAILSGEVAHRVLEQIEDETDLEWLEANYCRITGEGYGCPTPKMIYSCLSEVRAGTTVRRIQSTASTSSARTDGIASGGGYEDGHPWGMNDWLES